MPLRATLVTLCPGGGLAQLFGNRRTLGDVPSCKRTCAAARRGNKRSGKSRGTRVSRSLQLFRAACQCMHVFGRWMLPSPQPYRLPDLGPGEEKKKKKEGFGTCHLEARSLIYYPLGFPLTPTTSTLHYPHQRSLPLLPFASRRGHRQALQPFS